MKVIAAAKWDGELRIFDRLREAASGSNLVTASKAGALVFQNGMKRRAPKKTRSLSRSIHLEVVRVEAHYVEIAAGTDLEYAAIQEYGGTIKPKNAKWLAIPLTSNARRSVSPRNFSGGLRFVPINETRALLVDKSGKAQFALRKSVVIKAQPYARPTFDEDQGDALKAVSRVLRQLIGAVK